jgi:hypothetical protein
MPPTRELAMPAYFNTCGIKELLLLFKEESSRA